MDNEWIVGSFLVCVGLLSIDIFRRIVTEILQIQREQAIVKVMRRLRKLVQPWVTIILYGDSSKFKMTAQSLRRSHYHNFDIVVLGPRAQTYQTAYRKSKHGKIIIPLPAGTLVEPGFIKRAVATKGDQRSCKVMIREAANEPGSMIEIITYLQKIVWGRSKRVEVFIAAELKKKRIPRTYYFLPQIPALLSQIITFSLIAAGVIYADLTILWYAWILISSYLLILVWFNKVTSLSERFVLSLTVPSALFLVPVSSIIVGFFQLSTRK